MKGSAFADKLKVTDDDNFISGNGGNDVIEARGGNDAISLGSLVDLLQTRATVTIGSMPKAKPNMRA